MDPMTGMTIAGGATSLLGSLMSLLGKPKPPQTTKVANYEPDQMDAQNSLLRQAMAGIGGNAMENKARGDFASKTIPSISERFAELDGMSSSGYMNSLAEAGRGLEGDINAQRENMLMNLLQFGLTPQYSVFHQGEQPGKMQQFGQGIAGASNSMMGMGMQGVQTNKILDALKTQSNPSSSGSVYGNVQPLNTSTDFNTFNASNPKVMAFMNLLSNQ